MGIIVGIVVGLEVGRRVGRLVGRNVGLILVSSYIVGLGETVGKPVVGWGSLVLMG